jgi:hypothetical protein
MIDNVVERALATTGHTSGPALVEVFVATKLIVVGRDDNSTVALESTISLFDDP